MPHQITAEALARIEYKLDLLLRKSGVHDALPMHFVGHQCPACKQMVDYQIDLNRSVVVRKCGCTSGKLPPATPLFPILPTGVPDESRKQSTEPERRAARNRDLGEEG